MTDTLLQEIERSLILYRAKEYNRERTAKEILAKVEEKGWKSPEEVAVEKIVSYQVGSVDQREWLEKDSGLKWDREKVARELCPDKAGWDASNRDVYVDHEKYRKLADQLLALISPLIEDAKKQEREKAMEEEAFNIQCCVSDARRVHPDWTIDDVEELLEFREKTRKAIQSQSGDFIPLEEVRQALKEGEKDG